MGSRSHSSARVARSRFLGGSIVLAALAATSPAPAEPDLVIDPAAWRVIKSESGPVDYYVVQSEGGTRFVHARYVPPMKTTVLGYQVADADRRRVKKVRWTGSRSTRARFGRASTCWPARPVSCSASARRTCIAC